MSLSPEERALLFSTIGQVIHDEVQNEMRRMLEPIREDVSRLRLQLEQAELRVREYRHAGVWSERSTYNKGNTVSHQGSSWYCTVDHCTTQPGRDFDAWVLIVKRGADAPGVRSS